jgi:hypothetical protein
LLVEPQRTNLALYSSSFDNAFWTKNNSTATANATTSPSGIQDADLITSNSTTETGVYYFPSVSGTNTWSVYAKKGTGRYLLLNTDATIIAAKFDLQDGVIVGTPSAGATASIQDAGNGWYRCVITSATSANRFTIFITNNTTTNDLSSSVGLSYYLWGAQLEAGSYSTSYIPTTSASVTRNADVISKTGISSLIGTEFTLFYDGYETTGGTSTRYIILKGGSGTYPNAVFIEGSSSNRIALTILDSSASVVFGTISGSLTDGQRFKLAVRCKNNDFAFYLNGSLVASQASGSVPTTSDLYLGYYIDYSDNYSQVNAAAIWPTGLTNDQLATLTTL